MGKPTLMIQIYCNTYYQSNITPLITLIIIMLPLTIQGRFSKLVFAFARGRRNSDWIYSNKAEEMSHAHKGKVFICSHPGNDSYNCTMRMHKTLELSHIVLSHQPVHTAKLLQSIAVKQRFTESTPEAEARALQLVNQSGDLVSYNRNQEKKRDFEFVMEQSKHLEMAMEVERINRSNNDRDNKFLKKQQQELNKYLETSSIRQKLDSYRKENGFPRIIQLLQNYSKIKELRNGGINIFCFLDENHSFPSKALFSYLEEQEIPYQILPAANSIVSLLASSGFPADRFAIEYFPTSMVSALEKRKPMKMTVGIVQSRKDLLNTINAIRSVYGVEQMIYLESEAGKMIFRGRVSQFENECLSVVDGEVARLAIAPYISTFNQELKQERNRVDRLYGEAMSNTTHFVRMEFINLELKELLKRKDNRKVSVNPMLQELIARVGKEKAALIGSDVLGVGKKQIEELIKRAEGETIMDHLGLQELTKKR